MSAFQRKSVFSASAVVLALALSVLLTNCKKDDNDPNAWRQGWYTVVEEDTQKPIADLNLSCIGLESGGSQWGSWIIAESYFTTDANGKFQLSGMNASNVDNSFVQFGYDLIDGTHPRYAAERASLAYPLKGIYRDKEGKIAVAPTGTVKFNYINSPDSTKYTSARAKITSGYSFSTPNNPFTVFPSSNPSVNFFPSSRFSAPDGVWKYTVEFFRNSSQPTATRSYTISAPAPRDTIQVDIIY